MYWIQETNPLGNVALSALIALIPIIFLFWALIIKRMKGYLASLGATALALLIAITIYGMPVKLALLSTGNGILYGLFPICWIVVTAVFLFNITVASGQFEVIKHSMATITGDRRLQALIIAFSFGSFLEGTAGFGAPVAITSAMLVGLGFEPLYAAGICLIANTAPVAFGAIGTPVLAIAQVSGLPEMAISQIVGRTLPILSLMVPLYLVVLMAGFNKMWQVFPAILVTGVSFAGLQWFSSNFLGPNLPDIISGIGSIICLILFLKCWKPKQTWHFPHEQTVTTAPVITYTGGQIFRAWSPFVVLTILMIGWGLQPIKAMLDQWGRTQFEFPVLHGAIQDQTGTPLSHVFVFNYLSAAGTAILFSALIAMPLIGIGVRKGGAIFINTLGQLKFPIITISAVLGFAYIANDSGITISMANALAATGWLFPFFAPFLGWLGVFITGSDTSANALFGKLQLATANSIGVDPLITVGANASGGVVGKMISPQSIAVAAGAGGLIGKESDLFRFTVKHSFIMLLLISFLVLGQAYLYPGIIPDYDVASGQQHKTSIANNQHYSYFIGLLVLLAIVMLFVKLTGKRQSFSQRHTQLKNDTDL